MNGLAVRQRWLRGLPGLGMWGCALLLAVVLYLRQEHGLLLTGFAQESITSIAPEAAGRLSDVLVTPDQKVAAGDLIGRMDDTAVRLELAAAGAELRRLRYEAAREEAGWSLDLESDRRRFTADVDDARLSLLEARAQLASAQVRLTGLESALARTRALAAQALASAAALEDDSVACQAQRELVRGHLEVVAALGRRLESTESRLRAFADSVGTPASSALPAALAAAVEVQEAKLHLAELARARCELRAPVAGVVGDLLHRPGETIAAGDAVVTVIGEKALEVVAYAPEDRTQGIAPGQTVRLRPAIGHARAMTATVTSVAGAVTMLPERTFPGSPLPVWGLAVRVRLPADADVRPGEAFRITL